MSGEPKDYSGAASTAIAVANGDVDDDPVTGTGPGSLV